MNALNDLSWSNNHHQKLPRHGPNAHSYSCGTDSLNLTLVIGFGLLIMCLFAVFALIWIRKKKASNDTDKGVNMNLYAVTRSMNDDEEIMVTVASLQVMLSTLIEALMTSLPWLMIVIEAILRVKVLISLHHQTTAAKAHGMVVSYIEHKKTSHIQQRKSISWASWTHTAILLGEDFLK